MRNTCLGLALIALLPTVLFPAGAAKVFITESSSWQLAGGGSSGQITGGGGARPQTAEIIKTFRERCPALTVTMNKDQADFIVLLEHEGGKDFFTRRNKAVVFQKDGDAIFSGSTRSLGNAVKDACEAIQKRRP